MALFVFSVEQRQELGKARFRKSFLVYKPHKLQVKVVKVASDDGINIKYGKWRLETVNLSVKFKFLG